VTEPQFSGIDLPRVALQAAKQRRRAGPPTPAGAAAAPGATVARPYEAI
jgi:hypothetical protein